MSSSKIAAGVYLSEAQNLIPPPLYIVFTCMQYTYSQRDRGRGRELNQRECQRGNGAQSWVENTNMTDCICSL